MGGDGFGASIEAGVDRRQQVAIHRTYGCVLRYGQELDGATAVTLELTGGNALPFSNLSIMLAGGAVSHFGSATIKGVVTQER